MFPRMLVSLLPRASPQTTCAYARAAFVNPLHAQPSIAAFQSQRPRFYASKTTADEMIEQIQDQYATVKDEFEIASEETEKMSVYAENDREAAKEEFGKLKSMYEASIKDPLIGEEIRSRVGGRIRELDNAIRALEALAQQQD